MWAQLDEESVIRANAQFWEQMLAMKLEPIANVTEFCLSPGHFLGRVHLSGDWCGLIEVLLAEQLALSATAAMLMQSADTVAQSDTLDATKEIANMIAGSIKSSLPRPCTMTVPESAVELTGFCGLPRTQDTLALGFHHADGDLVVRIWEQECLQ